MIKTYKIKTSSKKVKNTMDSLLNFLVKHREKELKDKVKSIKHRIQFMSYVESKKGKL